MTRIAVAYIPDNKYIYPTIVSIILIIIYIYIVHPRDFSEHSKNCLLNVEKNIKINVQFIFGKY